MISLIVQHTPPQWPSVVEGDLYPGQMTAAYNSPSLNRNDSHEKKIPIKERQNVVNLNQILKF